MDQTATTPRRVFNDAAAAARSAPLQVELVTLHVRILRELLDTPRIAQERLARILDVTMRTVQRHLAELEAEGYISLDRGSKPYTYSVNAAAGVPDMPGYHVGDFLRFTKGQAGQAR